MELFQRVIVLKIGIFDSGIGGITVLHEALKMLPHEEFIYYADSKKCALWYEAEGTSEILYRTSRYVSKKEGH